MMGKLNRSVPNRFYRQVKLFPDHTALISKDTCLSYKELNRTANRVAHAILELPRRRNNTVGLLLEHDAPSIAAVLGALKAGKTYVPLDPSFPRDMLRHMVSNSRAFALITDDANRHLAEELAGGKQYIVNIDRLSPAIKDRNPRVWISPFDHAYIIYTSGSSGQPKGVLHTHRNITRVAADYSGLLGIGPGDRVSMLSTAGFSMSVIDIFSSLLTGAALCLFDIRKTGPPNLIHWLARENITHYQSTTTVFSLLLESAAGKVDLPGLRVVKLGGEPVYRGHWEQFTRLFPPGCLFVNGYGLTEILVVSQFPLRSGSVVTGERLPAGFVTPGCEVLLLDEDGKPVTRGEAGEIVIKSDYLFCGYWGKTGLTGKIFHTGDMGRMTPDGCLHIKGRKDFQVKIRGVRVELEEIEAILCSHNRVEQALVNVVNDGKGEKRLTAMVVPHEEKLPTVEGLKKFLHQKLPHAVVPSDFQLTAALPRTPSNKLDRKAVGSVFYFLPKWKRIERPLPQTAPLPDKDHCWVVFTNSDRPGLGEQLVKRLRSRGRKVVVVKIGDTYEKQSNERFSIRPGRNEDYSELASEIKGAGLLPVKIIYLWMILDIPDVSHLRGEDETEIRVDVERGLHGPVYLVQSFSMYWNHKLQIELVGERLSRITGEERPRPSASLILGPFRVIPHEYPHISCRCVDISPVDASSVEGMAGQLLLEFDTEATGQLVAYRNGVRYHQTLERVRADGSSEGPGRLREKGVYLVTGGLGGMGLAFAGYLAKRVRARLVLTGRSEFPARNRWTEWLETQDKDDKISVKIRKLLEIEAAGGEVWIIRADVCDRVRMGTVLDRVRERFGEINGVIHAAGIMGGDRMADRTPGAMHRVLAPRITGVLNLEAALKKSTPDFFVLCSSVTALAGGEGQVDYAAANAFLDAWAHDRAGRPGTLTVSINWDTWRRVGMAVDYYADEGFRFPPGEHPRLEHGLTTGEGTRALEAILHLDFPRIVVSKRYFESPSDAGHPVHVIRNGHPYAAPRNDVELMLVNLWEKVLKIDRIGIRDHFFNLGGDSLKAAAVFSEIEAVSGIPLALGTLVQSPTVETFGKVLKERNWASGWKYLVAVQPYGMKRPFFCVHPLSGNVVGFADLRPYMPLDRPFYAIQAAGLNGNGDPVDRVEIMAANYLREVRAVQPGGPYLLGGRCFGGLVAFEMALQLAAEGQETVLLVIMDSVPPKFGPCDSEKSSASPDNKPAVTAQDHRFNRVLLAHMRARFNYYGRPYPGELVLVASRQLTEKYAGGPLRRWRKVADRGVLFHEIPCHHNTLLKGPHAARAAELLKQYFDRTDI